MNGNQNPYDPTTMFKNWIQKSGRAQAEFMKNFGSLMTHQNTQTFNPLETLKEVSENARDTQSKMMQNMSSLQSKSMELHRHFLEHLCILQRGNKYILLYGFC